MTDPQQQPGTAPAGETLLLIEVPEAEPLVGEWRRRYDPAAPTGVPAHITVISPFLDADQLGPETMAELRALIGGHGAFDLAFRSCGRFPSVLYLAPEPAEPIRVLTEAVAARWPERPPYGGQFDELTPHLTVSYAPDPQVQAETEADLLRGLPLTARVTQVNLLVSDGQNWNEWETFALRG
ncbi:MAG TPA: 2'-5' RNA ligase family protein [Actinocrinis sp.]|nr:2'-5' RNA ligase family protein [Actinocrinis sp.]